MRIQSGPRQYEPLPPAVEESATLVVEAAFKVHRALGPGLLESVYEECLSHELRKAGVPFERQKPLPVLYDGLRLESGYRLARLVRGNLIVELKAVEECIPLYRAQVMTYLKLTKLRLGLLINFNNDYLKFGIERVIM